MKALMPVRRALRARTIFNVLGPLLNPAGARRQLMGVYSAALVRPVAEAMPLLQVTRAMVVHGAGGLDELGLGGPNQVIAVSAGQITTPAEVRLSAENLHLASASLEELAGGATAQENADVLLSIFAGERGSRRDVVLLNAAAVLVVADRAADMMAGLQLAAQAIDAGRVLALVAALSAK
jgi:anthranilate phosphoribosyltransferase